jgi:tRNA-dihydrouridine synthase 3
MADRMEEHLESSSLRKGPLEGQQWNEAHPPQPTSPRDSAVTKTEKTERNGSMGELLDSTEPASKRIKLGDLEDHYQSGPREKVKGIALVKPE